MAAEKLYFEDGKIIACTEYAAAYFGVTAATLSNWMKVGCPRHKYGYWDIREVSEFRQKQEGEKIAETASTDISKLSPQQYKLHIEGQLKQAQLEAAQIRNQIAKGDYLERGAVVADLTHFFVVLKQSIMGLGKEMLQIVQPNVDAMEARRMDTLMGNRVSEALEQLAVAGVYNAKEQQ